ncbi:hypothetical protein ACFQ5N_04325 [Lutibacter holmesii]|uniref:TonB C-terminal domain-containing protein n=1 Tax=Lutibacter holmesii TaxID=1137985 RepID=A0ABW3WLR1_9FLAO
MRKFKLLAIAFVFGTASLFASNDVPSEKPKKEIRTQIVELLTTPEFEIKNEINTMISFTFNSEGEIVVLSVDSVNPDILNYVRENLNRKRIQNPGERDKIFTMSLKVKRA